MTDPRKPKSIPQPSVVSGPRKLVPPEPEAMPICNCRTTLAPASSSDAIGQGLSDRVPTTSTMTWAKPRSVRQSTARILADVNSLWLSRSHQLGLNRECILDLLFGRRLGSAISILMTGYALNICMECGICLERSTQTLIEGLERHDLLYTCRDSGKMEGISQSSTKDN